MSVLPEPVPWPTRTVGGRIANPGKWSSGPLNACLVREMRPTRDATLCFKTHETSHDPQPGGNPLRIAPEGVIDKTVEQVRRQQRVARLRLDHGAHGVQPRRTGPLVELGHVVIDMDEIVLEH